MISDIPLMIDYVGSGHDTFPAVGIFSWMSAVPEVCNSW